MHPERRQRILLGGLLAVLAVVLYRLWTPSAPASAASNPAAVKRVAAQQAMPSVSAPDVHLTALEADRPRPVAADRDLFRFKPKAPALPPPPPRRPGAGGGGGTPEGTDAGASTGPATPSPPPPIALKFIGVVEGTEHAGKLAVLSDGRNVFHGREGDIIEGRFKILRIGAESLEMAYLDGRGRQTIRLSGS